MEDLKENGLLPWHFNFCCAVLKPLAKLNELNVCRFKTNVTPLKLMGLVQNICNRSLSKAAFIMYTAGGGADEFF